MKFRNCFVYFLCLSIYLVSCSSRLTYFIGMDPSWFPTELYGRESYINSFINELLCEIALRKNLLFKNVMISWDHVVDGLLSSKYYALLSFEKPTLFNKSQFLFSKMILSTGVVVVVSKNSNISDIADMNNLLLLAPEREDLFHYMQRYPDIKIKTFNNENDALQEVIKHRADGIILPLFNAFSYVNGIFDQKLEICGSPFLDDGIRLMALNEEKNRKIISLFDEVMEELREDGTLDRLLKKWSLSY